MVIGNEKIYTTLVNRIAISMPKLDTAGVIRSKLLILWAKISHCWVLKELYTKLLIISTLQNTLGDLFHRKLAVYGMKTFSPTGIFASS